MRGLHGSSLSYLMMILYIFTQHCDSGWAQQSTLRGCGGTLRSFSPCPVFSSFSQIVHETPESWADVYPGLGLPSGSCPRRSKARDKQRPGPYFLGFPAHPVFKPDPQRLEPGTEMGLTGPACWFHLDTLGRNQNM